MLSKPASVPIVAAAAPFPSSGAAGATLRRGAKTTRPSSTGRLVDRNREVATPHASFLQTLFSGGAQTSAGRQQAEELLTELAQIFPRRGGKPVVGPNERANEILEEIMSLRASRNPARSPLLPGSYEARLPLVYSEGRVFPPTAVKSVFSFSEDNEVEQRIEVREFGLFPGARSRIGSFRPVSSDTVQVTLTSFKTDKGVFGSESEPLDGIVLTYQIGHLDENTLVVRATKTAEDGTLRSPLLQYLQRVGADAKEETKPGVKSNASLGGLPSVAKKGGAATQAERSFQKMAETSNGRDAAAAEREARQEELRLQKEKAEAERQAALELKAEIKASVDGYNQRLKETQAAKKESAAELRAFERENSEVLKEVTAFRKEMQSLDAQIASLEKEVSDMKAEEKQYAQELKVCRQELTTLERKLATL